ncbi:hypothetical protein PTSG_08657 [Salpingoeca rosetta]|uniref:CCDC43 PWI-like domain-containing protein n=1 Tax=Salpingoeca rosetta (strain ATCC 50818 / BSB-021) TaxID=946362 RepID=F2UKB0_SALR5|nr:uncharacterized protein PTSG_08657 [Salpingoeca rosetta]EGD77559.1 hypothetical protein PTSG_08657 [Salpingoeca rosetta]|eukprot:XP_004990447.1 hypothetical protein PTSG_08657 [Salpingoeca rosetta]
MMDEAKVLAELERLGLDDETTASYVVSMLEVDEEQDESEEQEAVEGLKEFLEDAAEDEALVDSVTQAIVQMWKDAKQQASTVPATLADKEPAKPTLAEIAAQHSAKLKEEEKRVREAEARAVVSDDVRKAVLKACGDLGEDDDEDEEGEDGDNKSEGHPRTRPVSEKKIRKQRKQANANDLAVNFVNTNRSAVAAVEQQKREAHQAESKARTARNKAALAADKQRKEKAKEERRKKTQKQERRR